MTVYFILVEPELPENIGASARAIKTMGFQNLRLVNPVNHLDDRAKWVAHGSMEILESAEVYSTLIQATTDIDLVIGTTNRTRVSRKKIYNEKELTRLITDKASTVSTIGVVFGSEKHGLTNENLSHCDLVSKIPMHAAFPSLNLSQAVMLYAYIFSPLNIQMKDQKNSVADADKLAFLKSVLNDLLKKIDEDSDLNVHKRILERVSALNEKDLNLLHYVIKKVNNYFVKTEKTKGD